MIAPVADVVTTHRTPSRTSRLLYWGARSTVRHLYRSWPFSDSGLRGLAAVERRFAGLPHPEGVRIDASALGGVPVDTSVPLPDPVPRHPLRETTVLYLHGGGFVFCGPSTHRRVCAALAMRTGVTVHAPHYRMLPEVSLGGIVDDVYAAYRELDTALPEHHRIVVAGDSAGGFLAAKICELSALDGIRRPAAMVAYSPLLDLDGPMAEGPWLRRDALQPLSTLRRAQKLWARDPHTMRGARSILDVDPAAFPPTLITLAAGELVEATAMTLTTQLDKTGRTVETHRWHSAVHAFPVLAALTPESRQAGDITGAFLQKALVTSASTAESS